MLRESLVSVFAIIILSGRCSTVSQMIVCKCPRPFRQKRSCGVFDGQVHSRRACLVYLPAYIFGYSYGLKHTPGRGAIVPERFQALVGGSSNGGARVSAALHPSPFKVQLATAAVIGAFAAVTGPVTANVLGWDGLLLWSWGAVDTVFWGFIAMSAAGANRVR